MPRKTTLVLATCLAMLLAGCGKPAQAPTAAYPRAGHWQGSGGTSFDVMEDGQIRNLTLVAGLNMDTCTITMDALPLLDDGSFAVSAFVRHEDYLFRDSVTPVARDFGPAVEASRIEGRFDSSTTLTGTYRILICEDQHYFWTEDQEARTWSAEWTGPSAVSAEETPVFASATTAPEPEVPLSAASPPPGPTARVVTAPHAGWTAYTNGNEVNQVMLDRDGFVWAATVGGVVRFDAADGSYVKYTTVDGLAANDVRSMAQAPDGSFWFGTSSGDVSHWDGQTWTTLSFADGLGGRSSVIAVAPDGTLWFGGWVLSRFDGRTWTTYERGSALPQDLGGIFAIAFAPDGALWVGTGAGAARFDGKAWRTYTQADGLAGDIVEGIAVGADGTLWFACGQDGLSHYDGRTWTTYKPERFAGATDTVSTVAVGPDGTVWTGGVTGLASYDGATWTHYESTAGSGSLSPRSIVVDSSGRAWVGTESNGIFYGQGNTWMHLQTLDALPDNDVGSAAATPDGAVWFAMSSAPVVRAVRFDGEAWTTYGEAEGLPYQPGNDELTLAPDGALWLASIDLFRFDGRRWVDMGAPDTGAYYITAIAFAPDGTTWVGSFGGALRLQGQTSTAFTSADGLASDAVWAVAVAADGTAWLGTYGSGLSRFDGTSWTTFTTTDGLPGDFISALAVTPDGSVWAGGSDGVARFDGNSWTSYPDVHSANQITVAPDGRVWAATAYGAFVFDGKAWTSYTTADGLAGNDVQDIAVAADGAVWLATPNGVSRYLP